MTIGFDLDGTLDSPAIGEFARMLKATGNDVHIITGIFDEAGEWQAEKAKQEKLVRLGFGRWVNGRFISAFTVHYLHAVPYGEYPLDYRLRDLGLRKSDLCEKLGIKLFFDDSPTYCEVFPHMNRGTAVVQVR